MEDNNTKHGWTKDLNVQIKYPFFVFFKKTVITREDLIPYLIRTTIFSIGTWFSIKLHKIIQSDDACLHDHPWPFVTFILKGGYYEWTYIPPFTKKDEYLEVQSSPDGKWIGKKWHGPGSVLYRPSSWAHKLELKDNDKVPATTLVFTFKINRKWGFFAKNGWIYWRNYNHQEHC